MLITFLGTGTSHGVPMIGCQCETCTSTDTRDNRYRCSVLVRSEEPNPTHILVDCPPEFRLQAIRESIPRVDAVLLTHSHADHIFGLNDLRRYNHVQGNSIPILSNADTIEDVRRAFAYVFTETQPGGGKPQFSLSDVGHVPCFSIGRFWVYPLSVRHGRLEILGYRFLTKSDGPPPAPEEIEGGCAYVTDCNHIPDDTMGHLRGLNLLVIGALRHRPHSTHFTVSESIGVASRLGARNTLFTHIAHDLKHDRDGAVLPSTMHLAYDGLTVEVD